MSPHPSNPREVQQIKQKAAQEAQSYLIQIRILLAHHVGIGQKGTNSEGENIHHIKWR